MQEKKTTAVIFSEQLAESMKKAGLTQSQLAQKIQVTQAAVSKWLNGTVPKGDQLLSLSDALSVKMEWLLTGMDAEQPHTGGRPPIYNPCMSVRSSILKSAELEKEANALRALGGRLLAEADKLSEIAESILENEDEY